MQRAVVHCQRSLQRGETKFDGTAKEDCNITMKYIHHSKLNSKVVGCSYGMLWYLATLVVSCGWTEILL